MKPLARLIRACWNAYAASLGRVIGAVLSRRGLSLLTLFAAAVLSVGPWLRSSVSRDFRGVHIPWYGGSSAAFLPEYVAESPRAWRYDSIAVPLLVITAAGAVVVLVRPRWSSRAFGALLAASVAALAAALWNHPGLYEFFESEVRSRQMLRTVYRQESADLMTAQAPDRLKPFGVNIIGQPKHDLLEPTHPLLVPLRYWMYGPWLVGLAGMAILVSHGGGWPRRAAALAGWSAAGALLAIAATWPRLLAEVHWARAARHEAANDFEAAARSLASARQAMPVLAHTRRYWIDRGRLDTRRQSAGRYAAYFTANQYLNAGELDLARAALEPIAARPGTAAQRELLGEIIAHMAVSHNARGQTGAAETAWGEASAVAPWKPSYWVAQAVTALDGAPERAAEIEQQRMAQLAAVGDCFVSSDFTSALGDAYFRTGQFERARAMYSRAMDLFHLPKYVNLHAQEGRLGM